MTEAEAKEYVRAQLELVDVQGDEGVRADTIEQVLNYIQNEMGFVEFINQANKRESEDQSENVISALEDQVATFEDPDFIAIGGPQSAGAGTVPGLWVNELNAMGLVIQDSITNAPAWEPDAGAAFAAGVSEYMKSNFPEAIDPVTGEAFGEIDIATAAAIVSNPDAYGLTSGSADDIWHELYPNSRQESFSIKTSTGQSIVVNKAEIDTALSIYPTATRNDVTRAMSIGASEGVPWELIMMVNKEAFDENLDPSIRQGSLLDAAESIKRGFLYGEDDELMAYLYAVDPSLANKIINDPNGLTKGEKKRKDSLLKPFTQWVGSSTSSMEYDQEVLQWVGNLQESGAAVEGFEAPAGPEALDQNLQNLYKTWFSRSATEEELTDFREFFSGQLENYQNQQDQYNPIKNKSGQILDPVPRADLAARSFLKEKDLYKGTFGKMPSHMTEEEYAQTYHSHAAKILGTDFAAMNPDAAMAGMQAGDLDVVRQQGFRSNAPKVQDNRQKITDAFRRLL